LAKILAEGNGIERNFTSTLWEIPEEEMRVIRRSGGEYSVMTNTIEMPNAIFSNQGMRTHGDS